MFVIVGVFPLDSASTVRVENPKPGCTAKTRERLPRIEQIFTTGVAIVPVRSRLHFEASCRCAFFSWRARSFFWIVSDARCSRDAARTVATPRRFITLGSDIFVGTGSGFLLYFENTGSATAPSFVERTGASHPFGGSDVVSRPDWVAKNYNTALNPAAFDGDGDGTLDLVFGTRLGHLWFAKGNGDGTFQPVACRNGTTLARMNDPNCPSLIAKINKTVIAHREQCFASAAFSDVDGDGQLDIVLTTVESDPLSAAVKPNCESENTAAAFTGAGSFERMYVGLRRGDEFTFIDRFNSPFANIGKLKLWTAYAFGDIDNDGVEDMLRGAVVLDTAPLVWFSRQPRSPSEYGGYGYTWERNWPTEGRKQAQFMNPTAAAITTIHSAPSIVDVDGDGMVDIVAAEIRYDSSQPIEDLAPRVVYYHHAKAANAPMCDMSEYLTPQCGYVFTDDAAKRWPAACGATAQSSGTCGCSAGFEGVWNPLHRTKLGCERCAPGHMSMWNASLCTACPRGRHSELSGATACAGACVAGRFGPSAGQTNSTACKLCDQGTFSSFTGISKCEGKCDIGMHGTQRGATSDATCAPCPPNHVAITGQSACTQCEEGAAPDRHRVYCRTCPEFTFLDRAGECTACPATRVTCVNGLLVFHENAWYPPSTTAFGADTEMHACFNEECCRSVTVNASARVRCATEKGYGGALCGACDRDDAEGYGSFTRSGNVCKQCWASWASWLADVCFGGLLLIALAYFVTRHSFAVPVGNYGAL